MKKSIYKYAKLLRGMKGFVFAVFLVLLSIIAADGAEAAEYKTMYIKEQCFSFRTFDSSYEYDVAVFGKGERVSVSTKEYTREENGEYIKYRKYMHHGLTTYIPSKYLTSKKPKYSYHSKTVFYTLRLQEGTVLYATPVQTETEVICEEQEICTIGETNYWYKVFYRGQVCFIRKNSKNILNVVLTDSSFIRVDDRISSGRKNILKRTMYYYSFLPERIREELKADNCQVIITDYLGKEMEAQGASGYAHSDGKIYLKEKASSANRKLYYVEGTFLHEVGHILEYDLFKIDETHYKMKMAECFLEAKVLGLNSYYRKNQKEYIAESFAVYILNPQMLQKKAPETYLYFTNLYEN